MPIPGSDPVTQARRLSAPTDRAYERDTNLWVQSRGGDLVRIGLDELGQEMNGDLAFMQLAAPGTAVSRGQELGSVEAGKYVGPILSPVAGTVRAVNQAVLDRPRLANEDPLEGGWLVELELADGELLDHLVTDPTEIEAWFEARVREFRLKGVLAE
ncbi:MAG: glycine cleavage system protein H [Chloroflexota bacterium]